MWSMDVLISGAGVAGPCLAWWLARSGHRPTLVEQAGAPLRGGYIIDFWGKGYDLAETMGLLPRLEEVGYHVREVCMVDAEGRRRGGFSNAVFGRITNNRFVSLPRSELALALLDAAAPDCELIFGDSILALEPEGPGVDVRFEQGAQRRFDLVIGADGIHSRVRDIAFETQTRFQHDLGYCFAAFTIPDYPHRNPDVYLMYNEPERQAGRFTLRDGGALALFIWKTDRGEHMPHGDAARREWLRERFANAGWEVPELLARLDESDDLYMDTVSQIRMDRWHRGRIGLVGDAAFAPSFLAGQGSALAMIGAYVMAGEIARSDSVESALAAYEARLMPFMQAKQKAASRFAGSFVPASRPGIAFRNLVTRLMGIDWVADRAIGRELRDQIALPDYF
jgi:2-polyprenyl-6-methoxyphenol hydroxylase-like FAD-dependent oxidoreductase